MDEKPDGLVVAAQLAATLARDLRAALDTDRKVTVETAIAAQDLHGRVEHLWRVSR